MNTNNEPDGNDVGMRSHFAFLGAAQSFTLMGAAIQRAGEAIVSLAEVLKIGPFGDAKLCRALVNCARTGNVRRQKYWIGVFDRRFRRLKLHRSQRSQG